MSEQKIRELRDQLVADINRPDGRWGMHGHSCVDDWYFTALQYVVDRMDEALAAPAGEQVELTDAEVLEVMHDGNGCRENDWQDHIDFARAVIAAHEAKKEASK